MKIEKGHLDMGVPGSIPVSRPAHSFKVQTRSTVPSIEGGNSALSVMKKSDIHGVWVVRSTTSPARTSCLRYLACPFWTKLLYQHMT
uniref:Uncharacterized protein n=1 Tax=Timema poppense TaxID=170557 RepID=A0A7R9CPK3_TIMPO|nr:unnamed protein product [Timema poppensis]